MFSFFQKYRVKTYTDKQLFSFLEVDQVDITKKDIELASNDDGKALYKIGKAYYENKKFDKAFSWFQKASKQNNDDAKAYLARFYLGDKHGVMDFNLALKLSMKISHNPIAQGNIGWIHMKGLGVPENEHLAIEWFTKAANAGDPSAQNNLAGIYYRSYVIPRDFNKARDLILRSAAQGHLGAELNVGTLFDEGVGVPMDKNIALVWFKYGLDKANKLGIKGLEGKKVKVERLYSMGYAPPPNYDRLEVFARYGILVQNNNSGQQVEENLTKYNDKPSLSKRDETDNIELKEEINRSEPIDYTEIENEQYKRTIIDQNEKIRVLEKQLEILKLEDDGRKLFEERLKNMEDTIKNLDHNTSGGSKKNKAVIRDNKDNALNVNHDTDTNKDLCLDDVSDTSSVRQNNINDLYYDSDSNDLKL